MSVLRRIGTSGPWMLAFCAVLLTAAVTAILIVGPPSSDGARERAERRPASRPPELRFLSRRHEARMVEGTIELEGRVAAQSFVWTGVSRNPPPGRARSEEPDLCVAFRVPVGTGIDCGLTDSRLLNAAGVLAGRRRADGTWVGGILLAEDVTRVTVDGERVKLSRRVAFLELDGRSRKAVLLGQDRSVTLNLRGAAAAASRLR